MKIKLIFAVILFVIVCNVNTSRAQECQKRLIGKELRYEKINPPKDEDFENWKKINTKYISFYVPDDFKETGKGSVDFPFYTYESQKYKLTIDVAPDTRYPTRTEFNNLSFCEKFVLIDGSYVWIWHYKEVKDEDKIRYKSGAYFQFEEDRNYKIGISLTSETSAAVDEISERIIKSIQFNIKPKKSSIK